MSWFEGILSAFLAAVLAGAVLHVWFGRKHGGVGNTTLKNAELNDATVKNKVRVDHPEISNAGNLEISGSRVTGGEVKSDTEVRR